MFKNLSIKTISSMLNTLGVKSALCAVAIAAAVSVSSCGSDESASSKIDLAEEAAHDGKYGDAVAMCEEIVNSADTTRMTAHDFFRVATIYAIAADNDVNNAENMAHAAQWIERARRSQPDSVAIYIERLPIEMKTAVSTALDVANSPIADIDDFSDPENLMDSI
jgi:hypothetical protein